MGLAAATVFVVGLGVMAALHGSAAAGTVSTRWNRQGYGLYDKVNGMRRELMLIFLATQPCKIARKPHAQCIDYCPAYSPLLALQTSWIEPVSGLMSRPIKVRSIARALAPTASRSSPPLMTALHGCGIWKREAPKCSKVIKMWSTAPALAPIVSRWSPPLMTARRGCGIWKREPERCSKVTKMGQQRQL
jgi:hypothetical protein